MKKTLLAALAASALTALVLGVGAMRMLSDLPDVSRLKRYRPAAAAEVLDKDGSTLAVYFDRKFRIWTPISSVPEIVVKAVITAEDDTFFDHKGINYKATWDALVHDVQKRRFARGGSTITQQMIKNVFLSREKTISRKVREYILARRAEQLLSKRKILEIYLNEVEWGDNIYGIEAASRFYLDKHAVEITAGEAAMLAGMLPNPRYFNPFKRPDKARDRQERVLSNMLQAKLIDSATYITSINSPFLLRPENSGRFDFPARSRNGRPCFQHVLEVILVRSFGEQSLYRGGLVIRTSLDKKIQDELNNLEEAAGDANTDSSGQATLVRQNDRIAALVCSSGNETAILEKLEFAGYSAADFELETVPSEDIVQEQLVLSVEGGKEKQTANHKVRN